MIIRNEEDLQLKRSPNPIASIEVDIDAVEAADKHFPIVLSKALERFSAENENSCASIYTFLIPSTNFHKLTFSGFIGVIGDKSIYETLRLAFSAIDGVKVRPSDHINPQQSVLEYHIEDGKVWMKNEPGSWWAKKDDFDEDDFTDEDFDDDEDDFFDVDEDQTRSSAEPTRYRVARSDASIGTIKARIEEVFGLPEGSVVLQSPDGTKIRSDAKIATLRARWEY